MPILCSGMVAASLAAPIGAQHYPPRALRGASGSSAPGNRLPQPTTQLASVHAAGNCPPCNLLPCIPPWRYRRGTTAKSYRRVLPPARLPLGQPTCRACCRNLPPDLPAGHTTHGQPTCGSYYRAYRRGATAEALPQKTTAVCYRRGTAAVHAAGAYYLALDPAPSGRVILM